MDFVYLIWHNHSTNLRINVMAVKSLNKNKMENKDSRWDERNAIPN